VSLLTFPVRYVFSGARPSWPQRVASLRPWKISERVADLRLLRPRRPRSVKCQRLFCSRASSQASLKNPAVTMPPGAREETGTFKSTTA
jgi:hypothetical protein